MKRVALIADDLTGANDSGVQLAENGLEAVVWVDANEKMISHDILNNADAFVFNTDSRWMSKEEAYETVARLCEPLKDSSPFVYKKIDSTLRGNIGAELDALFDVFQPDFIAIVPSFPQNGRIVKEGVAYVHGVPLNETEMAKDPTHPMEEKHVARLIQLQTNRSVAAITLDDIRASDQRLIERIRQLRKRQISYMVFDAEREDDLYRIAHCLHSLTERVIWSGSAGLAQYIRPNAQPLDSKASRVDKRMDVSPIGSVLNIVGSVNIHSRRQLQNMLRAPGFAGIEIQSERLLEPVERARELERVLQQVATLDREQTHIVMYTSGDEHSIERAFEKGRSLHLERTEVTRMIADALGQVAAETIEQFDIRAFIMTGGDTAKQVFAHLKVAYYELVGQFEAGIPIGRLGGTVVRYFMTKAGGFGNERVLLDAVRYFERGEVV